MVTEVIITSILNIIQYKAKYLTPTELEVLIEVLAHYRTSHLTARDVTK